MRYGERVKHLVAAMMTATDPVGMLASAHGQGDMTQEIDLRQTVSTFQNGDYGAGIIHLAWNLLAGERSLLFACVELIPREMEAWRECYDPKGGYRLGSQSRHRIYARRIVVSVDQAIHWYESCVRGVVLRPNDAGEFDDPERVFFVSALEQEPVWPQVVCDVQTEFPFVAPWQLSPRLHHLVPAEPGPPSSWTPSEQKIATEWLNNELPLDLSKFREFWGSIHLVAPNPVLREVRVFRNSSSDHQGVSVELVPRSTVELRGLSLVVQEDRPTGIYGLRAVAVEEPVIRIQLGHEVERFCLSIVDEVRGLIYGGRAVNFLRQINLQMGLISAQRSVVVPAVRKRKKDSYEVGVYRDREMSVISDVSHGSGAGVRQLVEGHYRRQRESQAALLDQTWFDGDADAAAERLRAIVANANSRVLIVDPYFTAMEFRRFAFAAGNAAVRVDILTSTEGMKEIGRREAISKFIQAPRALEMAEELGRALSASYANPTQVRVMTGQRPPIHDRFLLVDHRLWSLGASLNEFGSRGSLMLMVPDPEPIWERLELVWQHSPDLKDWLSRECENSSELETGAT